MSGARTIVAIVGATATGKTDLGEALAERLGGEVVCADSRQVFRDLEAGTGKPEPGTRARTPHHLFDVLGLEDAPSAGWYRRAAGETCASIHARGHIPVLVGGSGLYVHAARHGLAATPPADADTRARLRAAVAQEGASALHARLTRVDPGSAARIAPADAQRIVRALEVLEVSGRPLSWWHARPREAPVPGAWQVFELTLAPDRLRERIERRTRAMFDSGLIEEVRALVARGLEPALARLNAIGYDEALALSAGALRRAEAEARTSLRTLQLAKRQRTWFRHQVDATRVEEGDGALAAILRALEGADRRAG